MSDGLSIRFLRQYDPAKDRFVTTVDLALQSCQWLGHTFMTNIGETHCAVCGEPNPLFDGGSITLNASGD